VTALATLTAREHFQQLLLESLQGEARGELQFVRNDGTLVLVLASLSVVPAEPVCGLCLVATELSQRENEVEELESLNAHLEKRVRGRTLELQSANEQLKQQFEKGEQTNRALEQSRNEQIRLRDEFLSHVSHELRSPLSVVHQFVSILLDGLGGAINADQKEYLEITMRNVNQLKGMIDDLLEASRADTCKLRIKQSMIPIGEVIKQTMRSFRATYATKVISLKADIANDLPLVHADPARICQVLTNLLDNAAKFSPPQSSITVRAHVLEEDPAFVCVSVADCGCGIVPEESDHIFERLYQAKNSLQASRRGLGLGLYICRELISQHGGRIWNDDKRKDGCTLSFTLPVFSVGSMIAPIIRQGTLIDSSFTLLTVEVLPGKAWHSDRQRERALSRIHDVLGQCILPNSDVLLPCQQQSERNLFWIVACTDQKGAEVIVKRIREQLSLCRDLQLAGVSCSVSTKTPHLDAIENDWPFERQVQSVVSCLGKLLKVEPV
jgi:signal transduction histidine kinase